MPSPGSSTPRGAIEPTRAPPHAAGAPQGAVEAALVDLLEVSQEDIDVFLGQPVVAAPDRCGGDHPARVPRGGGLGRSGRVRRDHGARAVPDRIRERARARRRHPAGVRSGARRGDQGGSRGTDTSHTAPTRRRSPGSSVTSSGPEPARRHCTGSHGRGTCTPVARVRVGISGWTLRRLARRLLPEGAAAARGSWSTPPSGSPRSRSTARSTRCSGPSSYAALARRRPPTTSSSRSRAAGSSPT